MRYQEDLYLVTFNYCIHTGFCFWFGLVCCFTSQSTAMVMMRCSVHLTTLFSRASLNKRLTSTSCTYIRLNLMIILHKSMGQGWDRTRHPWFGSQTCISGQTHYPLRYVAKNKLYVFI